jgi:hypothetical protein
MIQAPFQNFLRDARIGTDVPVIHAPVAHLCDLCVL